MRLTGRRVWFYLKAKKNERIFDLVSIHSIRGAGKGQNVYSGT